jgi:RNA polymerase sigma-70 factor, ECF subfamily
LDPRPDSRLARFGGDGNKCPDGRPARVREPHNVIANFVSPRGGPVRGHRTRAWPLTTLGPPNRARCRSFPGIPASCVANTYLASGRGADRRNVVSSPDLNVPIQANNSVELKCLPFGAHADWVNIASNMSSRASEAAIASSDSSLVMKPAVAREARIVALIEQGKGRDALVEMMVAFGDDIFEHCARIVNDRTLAADVQQQVFLSAFRDLETFQQRSTLRTWLFHIATHRALDAIRARRRRLDREDDGSSIEVVATQAPGPAEHVDNARVHGALDDCLARLPEKARAAVLLRFRAEMSYEEMADMLAEKPGTLQARVARALPALRACLQSKGVTP